MGNGEIQAGEVHRLRALDGGAEILRVHLIGEIAPVEAQGGKGRIVHGRRGGVPDG